MKKLMNTILTMTMVFTLAACSSGPDDSTETGETSETETAPVVQADPLEQYIGKYLLIEMKSGETDYADYLRTAWEDKSFYEYIEISEDSTFEIIAFSNGEHQAVESYQFDAGTHSVVTPGGIKEEIQFEGNRIILKPEGSYMVFEKTDEIPD